MLKKYLKLFFHFGKISLMNQTAYPASFILAVIGKTCRMLILIIFFKVIYFNVPSVAGWNFSQVMILVASYLTVESLAIITFHRNLLYYTPAYIQKGDFDMMLTKPINPLYYSSFRVIDFFDITSFLTVIVIWLYIVINYSAVIKIDGIFIYLILMFSALAFLYAICIFICGSAFWFGRTIGLGRGLEAVMRASRYPTDIFRGGASIFFNFIFPISIIATLPAKTLLNLANWPILIYSLIFTAIFGLLAYKFWLFSLKHYSSASS